MWKTYVSGFIDNQMRVIDHDEGGRTTSEGQAYGMFFSLVANDRSHFDGLLRWTEQNLAGGDLSENLPAWLWGHGSNNQWGVLDKNSASDADIWMAYTLLEAGKAWNEPRYTKIGTGLARQIAEREIANVPGLGTIVMPGPTGFQHGSYVSAECKLRTFTTHSWTQSFHARWPLGESGSDRLDDSQQLSATRLCF